MGAAENKQTMERVFVELAKGNGTPFIDAWADDISWTLIGSTKWSGTYHGKRAVLQELMGPLFTNFADRYTNTAQCMIADGDYVVVECRGRVATKSGQPYNNTYCWVCRFADGKVKEVREYLDTELVTAALRHPSESDGQSRAPQA